MYTFLFDKKSLVLLLTGMTMAGGLLFFGGILVGVQWGLPFETSPAPMPAPETRRAALPAEVPCKPEPEAAPVVPAAPEPSPAPQPVPQTFASAAPPQKPRETAPAAFEEPRPEPAEAMPALPEPEPEPTVALASSQEGRYSLQIGAFKRAENSEKVIQALQSKGYEPYVIEQRGRSILKTVRIGRYADRGEALKAAADFRRREGMTAIVRPIDS